MASGGGSVEVAGLAEPAAVGDADATAVADGSAVVSVPADGLGDGVEHAARSAAMSRRAHDRRGTGIGPIVDRSGRVAPQP
jgi:hypothetical protein